MGPNGFMGRTLLALQVLFGNVYFIKAFGDDASKKYQPVSRSHGKKSSQLHLSWTHKIMSTVKDHRHITNTHLKIIR